MSATNSDKVQLIVASKNPVKIMAAIRGYQRIFPQAEVTAEGLACESGVGHQPMSDAETRRGAMQRVAKIAELQPHASFWIGLEGGVDLVQGRMLSFAWAVVRNQTQQGESRSGTFLLPAAVQALIQRGIELGSAIDQIYGQQNSKQHGGAIGILSGGKISRTDLYEHAISLALLPFVNSSVPAVPVDGAG